MFILRGQLCHGCLQRADSGIQSTVCDRFLRALEEIRGELRHFPRTSRVPCDLKAQESHSPVVFGYQALSDA